VEALLTFQEVAALKGCSVRWVRELVRRGSYDSEPVGPPKRNGKGNRMICVDSLEPRLQARCRREYDAARCRFGWRMGDALERLGALVKKGGPA